MRAFFRSQQQRAGELLAEGNRLHHALLLHGLPGIGKAAFARALAQGMLCEALRAAPDGPEPCGGCPACRWFVAGHHPDFRLLERAVTESRSARGREGGQPARAWEISIDQVRDLDGFLTSTSARGHARVVMVDPADTLSTPAANALLKMLEEPGQGTFFLLVTHAPAALPATVRSRCRQVRVPMPSEAEAVQWLQAEASVDEAEAHRLLAWSGMEPLHARELADPSHLTVHRALLESLSALPDTGIDTVADKAATVGAEVWYPLLQRWVSDLLRVHAGTRPRFYSEFASRMARLASRTRLSALADVSATLQQQAELVRHPLNPRLFVESALATYLDAFSADHSS
ncbi:MAG: DNA polymerase III subunit delta' [Lautropia sp.]|nr:DNA polymerase III subunit delta' [Lautropia sp.]